MDVLVTPEQCLHSAKGFSASHTTPPESKLEMHNSVGGDTAGRADFNWPKRYSIPYNVMLSNKI